MTFHSAAIEAIGPQNEGLKCKQRTMWKNASVDRPRHKSEFELPESAAVNWRECLSSARRDIIRNPPSRFEDLSRSVGRANAEDRQELPEADSGSAFGRNHR
jgi:hypothetical protein